jgi:hypothetical protein
LISWSPRSRISPTCGKKWEIVMFPT